MTASQALYMINHWLHPHHNALGNSPGNLEDNKPGPATPSSSGCPGYQVGTGAILHKQQKLVHQVNEQLNLPTELQPLFDQALDNLANWLHLLPAHPQHHCEPAGALRHALETSFWSVAACQQIHRDHELYPDQRRAREPLWRLVAGIAGLLYDSGRMVSCLTVELNQAGQWPAFQQGLGSWLQQHRITRYSPRWQQCDAHPEKPLVPETMAINLLLLPHLVPSTFQEALQPGKDHGALWQTFISALSGQKNGCGVAQVATAAEVARLKSIKLHFASGEALSHVSRPRQVEADNDMDEALKWLKIMISALQEGDIKWAKDSLLLQWPDAVEKQEQLPPPGTLLREAAGKNIPSSSPRRRGSTVVVDSRLRGNDGKSVCFAMPLPLMLGTRRGGSSL